MLHRDASQCNIIMHLDVKFEWWEEHTRMTKAILLAKVVELLRCVIHMEVHKSWVFNKANWEALKYKFIYYFLRIGYLQLYMYHKALFTRYLNATLHTVLLSLVENSIMTYDTPHVVYTVHTIKHCNSVTNNNCLQ